MEWGKAVAEVQNMVSVVDMCCQEMDSVVQMEDGAMGSLGHEILAECV